MERLGERVSRGWLAVLVGLPFLLAVGTLVGSLSQIAIDLPYLPSRTLAPALLGFGYRLSSPVAHLVCVLIGPILLLAWWGDWPRRRLLACAGLAQVALIVALVGQRAALFKAARNLMVGGVPELALSLPFPTVGFVVLGFVLFVVVLWALPPDLPRVGRLIWLCGALITLDPVPVILGWFLPGPPPVQPNELVRFADAEVQHGGVLVDLTGGDIRLDGRTVNLDGLSEGLRALGHGAQGDRPVALSSPSPTPWGNRLRSGVSLALPGSASLDEVAGVLQVLVRHGIHEVHWMGANGTLPSGSLRRAFQQPSFTVLLDVPVDRYGRIEASWVWLGGGIAVLLDPADRCRGRFGGSNWLEALDLALAPCRDGVVLLPAGDLTVEELTGILDRLGGTGRGTLARHRVSLVPPGPAQNFFSLSRE